MTTTAPVVERWDGSSPLVQVRLLTERSLRAMLADPELVLVGLIQPVMMLFVFTQIVGEVIDVSVLPPGSTYLDFLMPAVLVNHVVQTSAQTGIGLIEDLRNGIVARLRSLPIRPSSLLLGRSLSDLVRTVVQIVLLLVLATLVLGYRPQGGLGGLLVAAGVTLAVGWALSWAFLAVGACLRRTEPMQNISVLVVVPLMFASSAFVPLERLPAWIRYIAMANPLTYAVDATRAVAYGTGGVGLVVVSLLISAAVVVVSMAIAVRGFRRPL